MVGIFLILSALFAFLSLIFHHPADYGSTVYTGSDQVVNRTGWVGVVISWYLLTYLGYGAYLLTAGVLTCGMLIFFRIRIPSLFRKCVALLLLTVSGLTVAALLTPADFGQGPRPRTMIGYGGLYGHMLMNHLLPRVGRIGAYFCTSMGILLSLLIGTNLVFYPIVKKILNILGEEVNDLKPVVNKVTDAFSNGGRMVVKALILPVKGVGLLGIMLGKGLKVGFAKTRAGVRDIIRERQEMYDELLDSDSSDAARESAGSEQGTPETPSSATGVATKEPDRESHGASTDTSPDAPPSSSSAGTAGPGREDPSSGSDTTDDGDVDLDPSEGTMFTPSDEDDFELPSLSLLKETEDDPSSRNQELIEKNKGIIQETLDSFGIDGKVVNSSTGPVITQYEIELAPGVRVSKLISRSDDFAIALKAASVRIVYPIPGKSTVGIEVPNAYQGLVRVRELWEEVGDTVNEHRVPLLLGRSAEGDPVHVDLAEMPHLLVAGTTGSGKSVCLKNIIVGQLLCRTPREIKLLMVDPKMVELTRFEGIPHLICPIIKNMKKVTRAFEWLVDYMEERYKLLQLTNCTDLDDYNALDEEEARRRLKKNGKNPDLYPGYQPRIVALVDELGDLMSVASSEVETTVTRIAQKARAVGIHMILSTQRPSSDVITGQIKSNMPARVSFKVMSGVNSRIVIDQNGAEDLIGDGDMLLTLPDEEQPIRSQGALIEENEIEAVCDHWKNEAGELRRDSLPELPDVEEGLTAKEAEMKENLEEQQEDEDGADEVEEEEEDTNQVDEKFVDAVDVVVEADRGSVSLIQRKLQIGYTRASRIMEQMNEEGIVGPHRGNKPRKVLIDEDEWHNLKENGQPM